MDEQHKKLIDILNKFYENISISTNDENIASMLLEMKEYAQFHFKDEERLLQKHAYPELEKQIESHNTFIEKVEDMERRFNDGTLRLSYELTRFLKDWLAKHIIGDDKEYGAYLKKFGVR